MVSLISKQGGTVNNLQIEEMIKANVPGIEKDFLAIKIWKEEPKDVPKYKPKDMMGPVCGLLGDVLRSKETYYYTDEKATGCAAGRVHTGLRAPHTTPEEWLEVHLRHRKWASGGGHKDVETADKYRQVSVPELVGYPERHAAVQIGLFRDIPEPSVFYIFCSPLAADIINRIYCYETGEVLRGFGSLGCCNFTIRYPFVNQEPTLTVGGVEWRSLLGLEMWEMTLSFPYKSLFRFLDRIPEQAPLYLRNLAMHRYDTYKLPTMKSVEKLQKFNLPIR